MISAETFLLNECTCKAISLIFIHSYSIKVLLLVGDILKKKIDLFYQSLNNS